MTIIILTKDILTEEQFDEFLKTINRVTKEADFFSLPSEYIEKVIHIEKGQKIVVPDKKKYRKALARLGEFVEELYPKEGNCE